MKDNAVQAAVNSTLDIICRIIDKDAFIGFSAEFVQCHKIYFRLRLHDLDIGGNESVVKILRAGNVQPVFMLAVARIGEEKDAVAVVFQLTDKLDRKSVV